MKYLILIISFYSFVQVDPYSDRRERMVKRQIEARGITNAATLKAMRKVPRHYFVPKKMIEYAYFDQPLSIGKNQTISQPYIVAYMTAAILPKPGMKVLEVGTGSGYQAAVLAEIVDEVYNIFTPAVSSFKTFQDQDDPKSVVLVMEVTDMEKLEAIMKDPKTQMAKDRHTVLEPIIMSMEVAV